MMIPTFYKILIKIGLFGKATKGALKWRIEYLEKLGNPLTQDNSIIHINLIFDYGHSYSFTKFPKRIS